MNYYRNAELRRKYGSPLKKEWQDAYCATLRAYEEIAKKLKQKIVYSIGDETTNGGSEALIIQVGKVVNERLPDLTTCSDINGYREPMGLAPYLNIVGFNHGWHGSYSTNRRGRRLITRDVIDRVVSKGATPWFINGGVGKEVELTLNIRDQLAANTSDYEERYMQTWKLKPGANTLFVNLVGIRATGSKRQLDLSCVFNIFFTVNAEEDVTLYFDNVRISMRR